MDISPVDTGDSLFEKLMYAGAELIVKTLPRIEAGEIVPEVQDEAKATYAKRLSKELGEIDWRKTAIETERQVRAFTSWPGAYTTLLGKTLKVWGVRIADGEADGEAGSVSRVTKEALIVNCGQGRLALTEVQFPGKKRMPVRDFLPGVKVGTGDRLGA